ncbi:MAG TPA: efflux RND transporter periplasmic adaptor subunit [Thermoanaerobaculia bacterium]|nr:efflux RND transporter periplasmic adaptor subunit [Thermoanaerobaculia bacterium]
MSKLTSIGARLLVAIVVVAVIGFFVWRSSRPKPVAVVLHTVERGRVERTVANTRAGTVHACRRAKLAPLLGGQIVSLPIREGDRVRTGQVLLELWSQDSVAQTHAAQEQARGAVSRAQEACLNAEIAERDAARARKLHRDGLLADDQLDRTISTAKTLRAACNAAGTDVLQSEASVQVARANLTRTVLRAPFDGVIAKLNGEQGEFTMPSPPGIPTPPVIDLIDDSCLYVTAPIDEVDVAQVRAGQSATITVEALPGRRFPGRVRRIAPYVLDVEKQARTVDVEVDLTNPADATALLAGFSADVEIVTGTRENVVRVPTQALREGNRALVVNADGVLEERRIESGMANFAFTEVVSGLAQGERIALSVERPGVVPGARVTEEKPPKR